MPLTSLPEIYTEIEVAKYLGMSIATLRRERKKGAIKHMLIGGRPKYTNDHITKYLRAKEVICQKIDSSSEIIGSLSDETAQSGAQLGSITQLDKQDASLSLQEILKKQKRN